MNEKRLVLVWTDILKEHGGAETINVYKEEYNKLDVPQLISLLDTLLLKEFENKPFRSRAELRWEENERLGMDNEFIVYDESNVDYKELLVSFVALMFLTNMEDRAPLIMQLAYCLKNIDKELSEQFRGDIAERVYEMVWE